MEKKRAYKKQANTQTNKEIINSPTSKHTSKHTNKQTKDPHSFRSHDKHRIVILTLCHHRGSLAEFLIQNVEIGNSIMKPL